MLNWCSCKPLVKGSDYSGSGDSDNRGDDDEGVMITDDDLHVCVPRCGAVGTFSHSSRAVMMMLTMMTVMMMISMSMWKDEYVGLVGLSSRAVMMVMIAVMTVVMMVTVVMMLMSASMRTDQAVGLVEL